MTLLLEKPNIPLTLRRYYVDVFFTQQVERLTSGQVILDVGGHKMNKRGQFDIRHYNHSVIYLNLTTEKQPDIQADAKSIPFSSNTFDIVICGELLEHVPDPRPILADIYRVLKPNGKLLITVPFLYPIHADPYDYGRYTDYYWTQNLQQLGFVNIDIQKQGRFWSVVTDMFYQYIRIRTEQSRKIIGMNRFLRWLQHHALVWDDQPENIQITKFNQFTTGYGIVCQKS